MPGKAVGFTTGQKGVKITMKARGAKIKSGSKLERRMARNGIIFLIPLMIGLVIFFLVPIGRSLFSSFSSMTMTPNGYVSHLEGLDNYREALFSHSSYRQTVTQAMQNMLITSPLVIVFSFFMAAIMNQKFFGRTFFRVTLFLPVIMLSSAMLYVNSNDSMQQAMNSFGSYKDTFSDSSVSFTQQIGLALESIGFDESVSATITDIVDRIYRVIELSGIQILVLLTGMQSISPSLYEAAKVEGGTAWENFWKITFPMVSPLILTCVVYTVVDSFTASENGVMSLIQTTATTNLDYPLSYAMAWIYFLIVIVILGVVTWLISRKVFYYDN